MGFKKQFVLISMLCIAVQAHACSLLCEEDLGSLANNDASQGSFLSVSLEDQTLAPTKRPCQVQVTLCSDSSTAVETFTLTRQDELRTTELDKFNTISIAGFIKTLARTEQACPNPEGTYRGPDFIATHKFDEQVYSLKIKLSNNPQDLNVTQVQFLERRYDCATEDF